MKTLNKRKYLYKIANKEEAIIARRFVYKRYSEVGYLEESNTKIFNDKYTKYSIYFIAIDELTKQIVGVIRLVKVSGEGLPVLNSFDVKTKISEHSMEIGNLVADPYNDIAKGLYKIALVYSLNNNIRYWYAGIDKRLLERLFDKYFILRFTCKKIANPKYYIGSVSVPIMIKIKKIMLLFL
jgi:hypothetical protein